ncbi:MAG: recombinase RecT [Chromatiaceae bacterium]|nr:recombinase RecT [Chromatiaceae bacterium]
MSTNLATMPSESRSVSTQAMVFDPETLANMQRMAEAMATARITVPKHLAGSPGDCLAIVMQAAQWQMNPFAVAQKTHVVNGALGYEAQLVNAVVSASSLLATRIQYAFEGDWKGCNGKADKSDERAVVVSATLVNEQQPRTLRVSMAQVGEVRNSPLWVADPRQQLAYLATKRWARLHAPDVMLGVYSVDELQDHAIERPMGPAEVVPMPASASRTEAVKAKLASRQPVKEPEPGPDLVTVLRMIEEAYTKEELKASAEAAKLLPTADQKLAREAYKDRVTEIKTQQEAEASAMAEPGPETQTVAEWQAEFMGGAAHE